ncbi:hypothetical protein [Microbacterium sp. MYb66]|jgi:hypothetical protein|uniref:hypothetical protein n=1 Tax=Microbacterium sp. MYb66 TaxID=1848692 RepID=UPI000D0057F6|nr:hypothetical protein [Microbacterium sp. MYb66]PRA78391.1 hypothetical protein CQ045_18475 [Microbacterium sp. MYb66]
MTDLLPFRTEPWANRLALALALPALLLGLAACSGTPASDASTSTASSTSESSTASGSADDIGSMNGVLYDKPIFEWQLRYAECMRAHGESFPDPKVDDIEWNPRNSDASDACYDEVGEMPAPIGGAQSADDFMAEALRDAQCWRDHGVSVEDPTLEHGLVTPDNLPEAVSEACDRSEDDLKKAQERLKEIQKNG